MDFILKTPIYRLMNPIIYLGVLVGGGDSHGTTVLNFRGNKKKEENCRILSHIKD